jgi:flagellar biosynthesis protein FliQ
VPLLYLSQPQNETQPPSDQQLLFNIWEAVIKIVVSVQEITYSPDSIVTNSTLVHFVQENCLNSLLSALRESTVAIIDATRQLKDESLNLFLYLLIAVTCSLFLSVLFLLPVISRAKRSKQEVLELFLHKKIERAIDA